MLNIIATIALYFIHTFGIDSVAFIVFKYIYYYHSKLLFGNTSDLPLSTVKTRFCSNDYLITRT